MKFIKVYNGILMKRKELDISLEAVVLLSILMYQPYEKNAYYAKLMGVTVRQIQNYLSQLRKAELIKQYDAREGELTLQRFIHVQEKAKKLMK